ncbi:tRNA (guanosine(46)-N7)-methyltransferase TrmB [Candidatus Izimaplasma bacterium ZiA1]|uniref:tRNA (guanosine(46)-N7)-methyltransferase TrmB n=1 Tax=Candidatus Izimoplasma sp. ZiA1 TaxID=2024899 RepID=UPI000BAA3B25|nr:tRNA (guanosine(46)-N7)-methyltransferase TrmB [Candidatus Izimaplasma bacterium ZiA1]
MRLRNVKGAKDLINSYPKYIVDILEDTKLDLKEFNHNNLPIHMEIGMGKGKFIHTLAKLNKDVFYVGIERFDSVIVRALEKVIEEPLDNLLLLRFDASDLRDIIKENSITRIYLNFSDPWPKARHEKRRLTSSTFLKQYQEVLVKDGELHQKTDNQSLFEYSIMSVSNYPMQITEMYLDLHNSEYIGNVETEFEEKFKNKGQRIYKLTAKF